MITVFVCSGCGLHFPSDEIRRCPECGGTLSAKELEGRGRVAAATELSVPPEGWAAPHRLVLAQVDGGGLLLALATSGTPEVGSTGRLVRRPEGQLSWQGDG
ncbi:MAG: hypothetical protein KGJ23_01820 [Euryarchaeota archaeon]|nr:hypothetical protein [Euryarchaeota archaeon]MDE1835333.1 hypothetical protein [Euryarchaeota archaeon]MDE1880772.1 hypothetical protein [Euryarchaeota archaeon]MDE2043629.1 hypothetical protein [Thermoplasmata archaeon]